MASQARPHFQYLFDSSGNWVAFRLGEFIYDSNANWIGWTPWGDDPDYVSDNNGNYLGHIYPGDRIYRKAYTPYRGYPGYPGYPGFAGFSMRPPNVYDIDFREYS